MILSDNSFLCGVRGLYITKSDIDETLIKNIDFFVDWVESNVQNISYLHENNFRAFIFEMKMMNEVLESIFAKWLQHDLEQIMSLDSPDEFSLRQGLLETFIVNAQTLAIDIQLAQNSNAAAKGKVQNDKIVNYKDIISSMKIITHYLEQENYDRAIEVTQNIAELKYTESAGRLEVALNAKDAARSKKLIDKITALYKSKIDDLTAAENSSSLKRVMLVDDMTDLLSILTRMLKGHYQVFAFANGFQALDFIDKTNQPDAFILDIEMPEINGFDLAEKIRERSAYKDTPIIFLTANSSRNTIVKSLAYSPKAFIVKPSSRDTILSKLKECFE